MSERESLRVTANGVSIYSYKNPALHSFYISAFVKAGCMYEDVACSGITHFLEHILIRNVNALYGMELYRLLDRLGLEFNASTYSEMVQFYVSGGSKNFKMGSEIITKILEPVSLKSEDIDAERRRIKAEIRESDDKNSLATFTNKAVFSETSLAYSIVGTNRALDRIGVTKLEEYRKSVLVRENMFFYVTGSFTDEDIDELARLIESASVESGEKRDNIAPVPKKFGNRDNEISIKSADYYMVRFTFDIDMTRYTMAEIDLLYDLLLSGYNSRLFVELSEKRGLFYDVNGAVERYKNIGTLYFSYEVKEKDICEAIAMTVGILNSIKEKTNIEGELTKAGYVDNAYMLYDDSRELNFTFSYDNHIMNAGYTSVEERKKRYESVSAERLSEVASGIFRLCNLTLTMKGKAKKIDKEKIKEILRELI